MKKQQLLIICLLVIIFIAGCTSFPTKDEKIAVGQLMFNQDRIKTIDVIKGAAEETRFIISDLKEISALINDVKEIPVKKLSKREDIAFMPDRIQDESVLIISLYSDDTRKLMEGQFFIWPDGYVYAVDVSSMQGNARTISYLSQSKYPGLYKRLMDQCSFSSYTRADQGPTLILDSAGNYTGFSNLPSEYTAEQAQNDGCYVKMDSETLSGQEIWDTFVEQSEKGEKRFHRSV